MNSTTEPAEGLLYTVSAPSGAGKTTLVEALVKRNSHTAVSVSHTTRSRRNGEQEGVNYYFVSRSEFEGMLAEGEFLEHATVYDNLYGTSRQRVKDLRVAGQDVILEIDWQGAQQVRDKVEDCQSVFILPPSLDALRTRLKIRGQDKPAVIEQRMAKAVAEMSHYADADYLVINDEFDAALAELEAILRVGRLRLPTRDSQRRAILQALLAGKQ